MSVINTNVSATIATNALIRNERAMSTSMERLSTGLRINSAKDDAAGLAISSRMKAAVSGLEMAAKNANDAISMLEVAEGATLEISNMLIRMRELAVQSASGTYSDTDRDAMDLEFGALMSEIDRVSKNTTWNTMSILNGADSAGAAVYNASADKTTVNIQLGANASQSMGLEFKSWVPTVAVDMQATSASGTGSTGLDPQQPSTVTFTLKPLSTGDTLTIGGKAYTAAENLTAAQAAEKFVASLVGDGNAIEGWTAQVDASNTSAIRFTSTASESVADLTVASSISADPTLVVTKQGAAIVPEIAAVKEVATLTFKPLDNGDTVTVDGFTFTAGDGLTTATLAAEAFNTAYAADTGITYDATVADGVVTLTAKTEGVETDLDLTVVSSLSEKPTLAVTTQGAAIVPEIAAVKEVATLTFKPLAKDDTVIVDGFTFTAASDLTAAEAAAAFNTAYTADTGITYDATVAGEVVTLTAKTEGVETDLVVTGTRANQALSAAVTEDFRKSESAFGDAILYWNDNGTAKAINIDTVGNSEFAIDQLDKAILGIATERAKYGAYMSRLEHSSDNLLNVAQNTDQSRSRIEDADYAVETSELARTQIISQASTAMLAQANQSKQSVLSLLNG